MATKTVLGDDPFGDGEAPAEKPADKAAAKAEKAEKAEKAAPKKTAKPKKAAKADATTSAPEPVPEPEPESAEPEPAPTPVAASASAAAPAPEPEPLPPPPPPSARRAVTSDDHEYGPSIDRPEAARHSGLLDDVRDLERTVKDRLRGDGSEPRGEHGGERQHLPLEFVWKRWRQIAMRDRSDVVDEFGRDPTVAARFEPLLDFLYSRYFRVSTRGMGHIPDTGRALIVSNHSGTLPYDGAMIMHAVRREHSARRDVRPLVEDFVFHFPYLGTLMNRIGGVRACPENAERLLQSDQLVAVFPEGIKGIGKLFGERYRLQRFGRGGFVKLALSCDAPIIPTAVVGAEEIHPMLSKITWLTKSIGVPYIPVTPTFPALGPLGLIPLPTKWFIAFGEPLYFNTEYGPEGASDRILVNKLAEQVRTRIQEMLDELLKERKSVLFG